MISFINWLEKNTTLFWEFPDDNGKNYKKNLRKMPKDWVYRTKKISYIHNEQGFREKSFSTVNWNESIVLIGDSLVYGTGVALENTLPVQLSNILDMPVINLGIPGSAIDVACINSMQLRKNNLVPKAIVYLWTSPDRYTNFTGNTGRPATPYFKGYVSNLDWKIRSKYYIECERLIWKDIIPTAEFTFFTDHYTEDSFIEKLPYLDYARDLLHPGIESYHYAAKIIASKLKRELKEKRT